MKPMNLIPEVGKRPGQPPSSISNILNRPTPVALRPPQTAPQQQQQPQQQNLQTQNNPGWKLGVNIAGKFAREPMQQIAANARQLVTQPIKQSSIDEFNKMSVLLKSMAVKSVPECIIKAISASR